MDKTTIDTSRMLTGFKVSKIKRIGQSDFDRRQQYERLVKKAEKLFLEKNAEYGDSIVQTGVLGAAVEIVGIAGRLRQLVLKHNPPTLGQLDETEDKLIDAVNYGIIGLMMLEEDNWSGE